MRQRCGNLGNCPSKNFHQIGLTYNCTGLIYNKRHFNQVARAKRKRNGKIECHVSLTIWKACENSISSLIPLRLDVVICWCCEFSHLMYPAQSCLVSLGSGLHMFFLRSWKSAKRSDVLWNQKMWLVTWLHQVIQSCIPLNSFRGPISLCIILGKEPGFCATNQSFNDSETPTKHCNKQKGRWKSKGLHSQTLTWKSHRIDGFCKWVGCLHSSFPIKLFKIPT